jgi:hypothetical protein
VLAPVSVDAPIGSSSLYRRLEGAIGVAGVGVCTGDVSTIGESTIGDDPRVSRIDRRRRATSVPRRVGSRSSADSARGSTASLSDGGE